MGVRWELEPNDLRIDPSDGVVAWTFKNAGDEPAQGDTEACTVTIWKLPDGVAWTRSVNLPYGNDVQPESGVHLSAALAWDGQEPGDYGVRIDFNGNDAMSDTRFHITPFGYVERFHG